ncbi:bifunctional 2-keto-4-hydroxyglutarate aldolase/2-keto-3-deoxy-6-phosphogluconate aldolase [Alicyclobacillus acidoterrestris]|uniref:bifunctional 2-keto-4-hydroxyglutarate aldolase/2-keto-3-deoxy-6-phosphogluconate aldolase n=1 Tax=Alicyclobacillus suci TaxID=2816080 RepID=UPI001195DB94|nr:bifunctional 2-keto-4-hydroxyglutarate aldolase/2-keto-3-deoxy-6-phosphogluconate aldolase [Alicyclobacillus suci]GEO27458.1 bifunctional 2-keto-4-hydroxyglutarate aldolase/2-keto-3-deoxy-6-phosphogluconate aldolase [Alicyclobacillus acidoterrestris]
MRSIQVIQRVIEERVIAVIRENAQETAMAVIDAAIAGGMTLMEVTMTTPGAIEIITWARKKYDGRAVIGAGTVLDSTTARQAILAGAEFVVSPALDVETVRLCHLYQVPVVPGVANIQGTIEALQLGCGIVKLFPSNLFSPSAIKAFKGPLPQAEFIPTGGVNADNLREWLAAGALAVGIGSDLSKQAKAEGNMESVTAYARRVVQIVNDYRAG